MNEPLTPTSEADRDDDAPYGQVMLLVFSTAVLVVSVSVALLVLEQSWWMLGAVFALHITATVVVSSVIARALLGRTQPGTGWLHRDPALAAAADGAAHPAGHPHPPLAGAAV